MKKAYIFFVIATCMAIPLVAQAKSMSVQIKESTIRVAPSFLAKIVQRVHYAQRVDVIHTKKGWSNISINEKNGWIHSSALSEEKLTLRSGSKNASTSVSSNEVILAGKGFSKANEAQYQNKHNSLRFDIIDKIESYKVDEDELSSFIDSGKLSINGGVK